MDLKFCAVDVEGDAGDRGLLGMAFYSSYAKGWITDPDEMRSVLTLHAQAGYTFLAHNAQYDLSVLWWQLGLPMKSVEYNGRWHHGSWSFSRRQPAAQLWCTQSMSGIMPLRELGKAVGLPKLPTPVKITGREVDRLAWQCDEHLAWECLQCYAVRDAEIVYRFAYHLETELGMWDCAPKPTLAAMAHDVWIKLDNPGNISLRDGKIEKLGRACYLGGRIEAFQLGHLGQVYAADMRSAYGSAMYETPMPDPHYLLYVTNPDPKKVRWDYEGVVEADVQVPASYCPPLPATIGGKRLYPVGRFRYQGPILELRYGMSQGVEVERVHRLCYSSRPVAPFVNYVASLWNLRQVYQEEQDPRQVIPKLLLSNLYGRLGIRETCSQLTVSELRPDEDLSTLQGDNFRRSGGKVLRHHEREQVYRSPQANVLWAAQITGAVRVRLHQAMMAQGTSLVYVHTDSIISTVPISGLTEGLGGLRSDGEYERCEVYGPQLLALQQYSAAMSPEWRNGPCQVHGQRACSECRWVGRAAGIPSGHALSYLRTRAAEYAVPVSPAEAARSGAVAGSWHVVQRHRALQLPRREPTEPGSLTEFGGHSQTAPPVVGLP